LSSLFDFLSSQSGLNVLTSWILAWRILNFLLFVTRMLI